jgi:hypothetical protein
MTFDLKARKLIVAAYWYYVLNAPQSYMTDSEYDQLSNEVADHWNELHPDRQWAFGTPEALRATGHHIKFSCRAVDGASLAYKEKFGKFPDYYPDNTEWIFDEDHQSRYIKGKM